jgi:hypothetical protein
MKHIQQSGQLLSYILKLLQTTCPSCDITMMPPISASKKYDMDKQQEIRYGYLKDKTTISSAYLMY